MFLKNIELINFRNYESQKFEFSEKLNIIHGKNGQGKTNLLEAIFMLSTVHSYRTRSDKELINFNKDFFRIETTLSDDSKISYAFDENNRKLLKFSNEKISPLKLMGKFNAIIFTPDDSMLIKGSPSIRRKFFDLELSKDDNEYLINLKKYKKVLKTRNMSLKSNLDENLIAIYEKKLAEYGSILIFKMRAFIKEISNYANDIYNNMNNKDGKLKINYINLVPIEFQTIEEIREYLEKSFYKRRKYDIVASITTIGLHRDEYLFFIGNDQMKQFSSQGQIKSAVLSLKMSIMEYIYKRKNFYPVLLLDDITSELDKDRLDFFLKYIIVRGQILLTTTGLNNFREDIINNSKIMKVSNGKIV